MEKTPEFDRQQLEYLYDTHFLLAKRKISKQLDQLLATTERGLVKWVHQENPSGIPEGSLTTAGKISRGENYRGLPYLVLDYPRLFSKEDIFSFRTMCWWGHFFSCSLHLQGKSLENDRQNIREPLLRFRESWPETYICANKSPWEYHYSEDNYQLLHTLNEPKISSLVEKSFVKISRKTGLDHYRQVPDFALQCFRDFLALTQSSH